MDDAAADARAESPERDPWESEMPPSGLAGRSAPPPAEFASSEATRGRPERWKGNGNILGRANKRAVRLEREDGEIDENNLEEMLVGKVEPARPRVAKRARLVIYDDDDDDEEDDVDDASEGGGLAAALVESKGDDDDDHAAEEERDGGVQGGASDLCARAAAEREEFLCHAQLSDEETEDEIDDARDGSDEDFVRSHGKNDDDKKQRIKSGPSMPRTKGRDAEPALDERLMTLVIEKKQKVLSSCKRRQGMTMAIWNGIANELQDDRLPKGSHVKHRVRKLLDAWRDRAQSEREVFPATLATLVHEYAKLSKRSKQADTTNADGESTLTSIGASSKRKASKNSTPDGRSGRAASVRAASDELLVKVVLQHRTGLAAKATAMDTWQVVADTIAPKFASFKSGHTAEARFEWLVKTYEDVVGAERAGVAEPVRAMIEEFIRTSIDDQTELLMQIVDQHTKGAVTPCKASADDWLLREVLLAMPFHRKSVSDQHAAWEHVASTLNSKTFSTGARCRKRVKNLMQLASSADASPGLTVKALIRLRIINAARSWNPSGSDRLLREYRALLTRIDNVIEDRISMVMSEVVMSVDNTEIVPNVLTDEAAGSLEAARPVEHLEDPTHHEQPEVMPTQHSDATLVASQQSTNPAQAGKRSSVNESALENVQTRLSAESAGITCNAEKEREGHRADFRLMMEMIKAEREAHHRETTAMIALMQQDRADHRSEFMAMMEFVVRAVPMPGRPLD